MIQHLLQVHLEVIILLKNLIISKNFKKMNIETIFMHSNLNQIGI